MPFESWYFLRAQPYSVLIELFWYVLIFEIPHYLLGFVAVLVMYVSSPRREDVPATARISVLLAGHNEENSFAQCVRSLRAQGDEVLEIIAVDDGSTDRTYEVIVQLERAGLIHRCARLQTRGGKAAARRRSRPARS